MQSIFASFTPNMQADDVWLSLKLLLNPLQKSKRDLLKKALEDEFSSTAFLTDSARTALYRLLKAYNFPKQSEVIVQSLTCSVVSNSIIQSGNKPIYADINPNTYNFDLTALKQKITPKTKAIIVQHTFGIPGNIQAIKEICEANNLILIEDLAISFGAKIDNKLVGNFGDSSIISFSSAKVLSSSRGGALITKNSNLIQQLHTQTTIPFPRSQTTKHLLKIIGFSIGKATYNFFKLGKIFLYTGKKLGIWPQMTTPSEKSATAKINIFEYSPKLATIAYNQWQKRKQIFAHRQQITNIYQEYFKQDFPKGTVLMTYPLKIKNRQQIINKLKQSKIYLDNWYQTPIAPVDSNLKACHYIKGDCPNAEATTQELLTLPLHSNISPSTANKIAKIIIENS